jgi:hypothetical protein
MRNSLTVFLALFSIIGCDSDKVIEPSAQVYKSRGSFQCTGGGTSPEVMKDELISAGIEVRSYACGVDGLAYIALCGAPDGAINIFEIPRNTVEQAQTLGFSNLSTLPNSQETPCP